MNEDLKNKKTEDTDIEISVDDRIAEIKNKKKKIEDNKKEEKEEDVDITERYVEPHNVVSRIVHHLDTKRVMEEANIMFNLLFTPYKLYNGGMAIAHAQIDKKDPLRFFVTRDKQLIINPIIKKHTRHTVDSLEGCLTFADKPQKVIQRYNKCEVEYQTLVGTGELTEIIKESLSGKKAFVFQHECDHLEAEYIY